MAITHDTHAIENGEPTAPFLPSSPPPPATPRPPVLQYVVNHYGHGTQGLGGRPLLSLQECNHVCGGVTGLLPTAAHWRARPWGTGPGFPARPSANNLPPIFQAVGAETAYIHWRPSILISINYFAHYFRSDWWDNKCGQAWVGKCGNFRVGVWI